MLANDNTVTRGGLAPAHFRIDSDHAAQSVALVVLERVATAAVPLSPSEERNALVDTAAAAAAAAAATKGEWRCGDVRCRATNGAHHILCRLCEQWECTLCDGWRNAEADTRCARCGAGMDPRDKHPATLPGRVRGRLSLGLRAVRGAEPREHPRRRAVRSLPRARPAPPLAPAHRAAGPPRRSKALPLRASACVCLCACVRMGGGGAEILARARVCILLNVASRIGNASQIRDRSLEMLFNFRKCFKLHCFASPGSCGFRFLFRTDPWKCCSRL